MARTSAPRASGRKPPEAARLPHLTGSTVTFAAIGPISIYLPEGVETNEWLGSKFPKWNMGLIYEKTGIQKRHIARDDQCASDLGVAAAEKLFNEHQIDRESIDFLLFCTQTPDYPLPTTACLMQERLGLPTRVGALDFNLGCSGFVYGLSLAEGLLRSGAARRVLLITAETYSKYIHPEDRSLRTVFGDGAAATLIEAADRPSFGSFVFGTDGKEADTLFVSRGGARQGAGTLRPRRRQRWQSSLYMDGPSLIDISLERIPALLQEVLDRAKLDRSQIDLFLMHQATHMLLSRLRQRLELDEEKMPTVLRDFGNTVSSTLPIAIHQLRCSGRLRPGVRSMLIGFGVGFSWAGCIWTETWQAHAANITPRAA